MRYDQSRRQFVRLTLGAMLLAATDISHANNQSAYWAATAKQNQQYMLYLFDDNNQVIRKIQLPGRAHGLSQSTNGQLVVSSRRPGTWLLLLAHATDQATWLQLPQHRRLAGHTCFSRDNKTFYSGEWLAASSPRGNRVVFWHLALHHTHYHTLTISDVCGLRATAQAGQFIISTGLGSLYQYCAITNDLVGLAENTHLAWDNHLSNRPQSALIPVKIAT